MKAIGAVSWSLVLASAFSSAYADNPLTVGSPAPQFKVASFLRGEPVKELGKGSVYAIEFSGTQCAPCVRSMPHLTEIQKAHPELTIVSVYDENPDAVRDHIALHDAQIGYRVALDDKHAMFHTWQLASQVQGIPTVYLVDKAGVIAWIGSPDDLEVAFGKVLAGSLDSRLERVRLSFEQAQTMAERQWRERRDRSGREHRRLQDLVAAGKWADAVKGAEQAIQRFPDEPFYFHLTKLFALASSPDTAEQATRYAAQLSAMMTNSPLGDLGKGRSGTFDPQIAQSVLGGAEDGDPILAEAAAILLRRAEAGLVYIKDEAEKAQLAVYISQIDAMVDARKKDYPAAIKRLRQSLDSVCRRQCPETSAEALKAWERSQKEKIAEIEFDIAEYAKKAEAGRAKP